MTEFEEEMRRAMQRQSPPPGFAEAVLARTRANDSAEGTAPVGRKTPRAAGWPSFLLLAASLLLACGSALEAHHQREVRAQRVAGQFNLALAVTARTLHHIDLNVGRAGTLSNRQANFSQDNSGGYQ